MEEYVTKKNIPKSRCLFVDSHRTYLKYAGEHGIPSLKASHTNTNQKEGLKIYPNLPSSPISKLVKPNYTIFLENIIITAGLGTIVPQMDREEKLWAEKTGFDLSCLVGYRAH